MLMSMHRSSRCDLSRRRTSPPDLAGGSGIGQQDQFGVESGREVVDVGSGDFLVAVAQYGGFASEPPDLLQSAGAIGDLEVGEDVEEPVGGRGQGVEDDASSSVRGPAVQRVEGAPKAGQIRPAPPPDRAHDVGVHPGVLDAGHVNDAVVGVIAQRHGRNERDGQHHGGRRVEAMMPWPPRTFSSCGFEVDHRSWRIDRLAGVLGPCLLVRDKHPSLDPSARLIGERSGSIGRGPEGVESVVVSDHGVDS